MNEESHLSHKLTLDITKAYLSIDFHCWMLVAADTDLVSTYEKAALFECIYMPYKIISSLSFNHPRIIFINYAGLRSNFIDDISIGISFWMCSDILIINEVIMAR